MEKVKPLVSIMIPNRNYSKFLEQCIESSLNQTYKNIEIIVLDNCSTDNSLEIATKYIKKGVRVCKNPQNIANKNYNVLSLLAEGEYIMLLPSDDMIKPSFVERGVNILEKYPDVGYMHCERDYIDTEGNITILDPFYNCNFIAPGESVLPIYMLTDVGQPAQSLIRRSVFDKVFGYNTEFDHTNSDRDLWFKLSTVSNYAYIMDKLSLVRIHDNRETLIYGYKTFYHPLSIYLMTDYQAKQGENCNYRNVVERLPSIYKKLSTECLQIAYSLILEGDGELAKQYMFFSQIINEDIINNERYKKIENYFANPEAFDLGKFQTENDLFINRKRSYDPPEGAQIMEVNNENSI